MEYPRISQYKAHVDFFSQKNFFFKFLKFADIKKNVDVAFVYTNSIYLFFGLIYFQARLYTKTINKNSSSVIRTVNKDRAKDFYE